MVWVQDTASVPKSLSASLSWGEKQRRDQNHLPLKLYWYSLTLKWVVPAKAQQAADQQTEILFQFAVDSMFLCQTWSENSRFPFIASEAADSNHCAGIFAVASFLLDTCSLLAKENKIP